MTGELAKALVAAQADMPPVEPDAVNPHFRSKFVSLDHLIAKTRPVLNKHGLAIKQAPAHIDGQPALATTLYHASGESVTDVMPLILAGSDMQKLGAALTYARRYAWAAALGIAGEEDDDGNAASSSATTAQTQAAPATPQDPGTTARVKKLLELVAEKGGDTEKTAVAAETAQKQGKLDTWLPNAEKYWAAQTAGEFKVPVGARGA